MSKFTLNLSINSNMVNFVVTELSLRFRVKFHRRNEKNRGFHLIPKTPLRSMYPKVIIITTFKGDSQILGGGENKVTAFSIQAVNNQ